MPRKSFNDPGHAHYLTFSCYRSRQMLTDNAIRLLFTQSLDTARQSKGFLLWAYVPGVALTSGQGLQECE